MNFDRKGKVPWLGSFLRFTASLQEMPVTHKSVLTASASGLDHWVRQDYTDCRAIKVTLIGFI